MKHRARLLRTALQRRGFVLAPLAFAACSHDAGHLTLGDASSADHIDAPPDVQPDVQPGARPDVQPDAQPDAGVAPSDAVVPSPDADAAPPDTDADAPGADVPPRGDGPAPCPPGCSRCASGSCDDVLAVSVGREHACARMRGGAVRCWGAGGWLGSLPPWDRPVPTPVTDPVTGLPFEHVEEVVAGYAQTCVRTSAGVGTTAGVRCWGSNLYGQNGYLTEPAPPRIALPPTAELAVTLNHLCARALDGTVRCWGQNHLGQLGVGSSDDSPHPTPAPVPGLVGVAQVVVGSDYEHAFSCAIVGAERAVRCWGSNFSGQLGLGGVDVTPHPSPTPVPGLTGVTALAAGDDFVCALMGDGTVRCWGARDDGRLGTNPSVLGVPTTVPGLTGVTRLAAGGGHVCAVRSGRTLTCWGLNASGQLGGGTTDQPRPGARVDVALADVTDVAAGGSNTCAIRSDGALFCWGRAREGKVADAATTERAPTAVTDGARAPLAGVESIAAGFNRGCAVRARQALCWGSDGQWQATYVGALRATPVALGGRRADALAIGDRHACVLDRDDGAVRCWGANDQLQLGETNGGLVRESPADAPAVLTGASRIAAGDAHTCALTPAGVSCWGWGGHGQLGRGLEPGCPDRCHRARPEPVSVVATAGATDLAAAYGRTCVVLPGGGAYCFGQHFAEPAAGASLTPTFQGVTRVALGVVHACAVTAAGGVACMGINNEGQLAAPETVLEASAPRSVEGLSGVTRIAAGVAHTCALQGGRVWCWGLNNFGQVGDGTLVDRRTPHQVATPADALDVAAGGYHTCALLTGGAQVCWGRATDGQLGNGTPWQRAAPAQVAFR